MDLIRIEGLALECILGVRAPERRRRQPVRLDLELSLDLSRAGRSGRIARTVDYSRVADEVSALLTFREYRLIESAVEELAAMLLGAHENLHQVDILLEKPAALHGRARSASVRIRRHRDPHPGERVQTEFGERELLLATSEAGLYLFHVAAGRTVTLPVPPLRGLCWLVGGRLAEGEGDPAGSFVLDRTAYRAPDDSPTTLFVCTCPILA